MPSILFVHENFPAQFGGIANYLATQGWRVVFATGNEGFSTGRAHQVNGFQVVRYKNSGTGQTGHPYLAGTEKALRNGQGFARVAASLAKGGFTPDVIVAHSGWGSGSFAKVVWPKTKLVQYLEWWYRHPQVDTVPGQSSKRLEDHHARTIVRNLPFLLDFQQADLVLSPTEFQASQAPDFVRAHTVVQHDGIDCRTFRPLVKDEPLLSLKGVPDTAPILTFATRGMEPLRGFPDFMAAAAQLLKDRPDLHVVVAGEDRIAYGPKLPNGESYKTRALAAHDFDESRLHFPGILPKGTYARLLRRSAVHAYLTRPFVLSWSLIEAMASGCPLVTTNVDPVIEALGPGTPALAVEPGDILKIVRAANTLLDSPDMARAMGRAARERACRFYDSKVCHTRLAAILSNLVASPVNARDQIAFSPTAAASTSAHIPMQ
ncbi:glycosyltransferase involved in cell wall biosynthesis [Litoreibacter ponti]|uniref:Glycosyltransferase involved in cell wall biosynthesis n=2 Tax=Litoreibacter ponti TaxID=1510457 RepID=A0A2T6BFZ2_9RHOB|nr:glycosyltransferase involved in cell wall biosynthesis [Litoreibacter ponti]